MVKRVLFAAIRRCSVLRRKPSMPITPEAKLLPIVTQEVCTSALWGYDEVRTDCRTEVRAAPKVNPALRGICTIYYGRRTCH
ncbi:MAG TPA: hypothetical protein VFD26_04675 [Methyloceanibacter sp.]|nr:hypothetical protein [Methyloceanibacter sp.]